MVVDETIKGVRKRWWMQSAKDNAYSRCRQGEIAYADVAWVVWQVAAKLAVAGCPVEHRPADNTVHQTKTWHFSKNKLENIMPRRQYLMCSLLGHSAGDRVAQMKATSLSVQLEIK